MVVRILISLVQASIRPQQPSLRSRSYSYSTEVPPGMVLYILIGPSSWFHANYRPSALAFSRHERFFVSQSTHNLQIHDCIIPKVWCALARMSTNIRSALSGSGLFSYCLLYSLGLLVKEFQRVPKLRARRWSRGIVRHT